MSNFAGSVPPPTWPPPEAARITPSAKKSRLVACLLGLLLAGLGHLYLGETRRGSVLMATFAIGCLPALLLTDVGNGGPAGLIGLGAIIDAYVGARRRQRGGRPRQVPTGLWVLAAIVSLLVAAVFVWGPFEPTEDRSPAAGRTQTFMVEDQIRDELAREVTARRHVTAQTTKLRCTPSGPGTFACDATVRYVSSSGPRSQRIDIEATCDARACSWRGRARSWPTPSA